MDNNKSKLFVHIRDNCNRNAEKRYRSFNRYEGLYSIGRKSGETITLCDTFQMLLLRLMKANDACLARDVNRSVGKLHSAATSA